MNYKWFYQIPLVFLFSPIILLSVVVIYTWYITYAVLFYEQPVWDFDKTPEQPSNTGTRQEKYNSASTTQTV